MPNSEMFAKTRAAAIADIHKCEGEGKLMIERIEYPPEFRQELSDRMAKESPDKNRRVGDGETSLIYYYNTVAKGFYKRSKIISGDSDVEVLVRGTDLEYSSGK